MPEGLALKVELGRPDFSLAMDEILPSHGITAVSGPSGSGKTTLLRIVAGLEAKAEGRVALNGKVWQDAQVFVAPHKRRIGMVFQEPRLFPNLNVRANLLFGAKRAGLSWPEISPLVTSLGVDHLLERSVRGLSGGEQRRVALARALAMKPELLLLDEPLTGLDRAGKRDLLPFLCRAVAQANCPALFVSHDEEEIAALSDLVLTVEAGRATGPLAPVPDCFDAVVTDNAHGRLRFALGHSEIVMPGDGAIGSMRRLKIPMRQCIMLPERPNEHSGQACIAGQIIDISDNVDGPVAHVDIGGPVLRVPCRAAHASVSAFKVGAEIWCLALSVQVMPERTLTTRIPLQNQ